MLSSEPSFFIWLGVVPYLTKEAIFNTLTWIAGIPGSEVVFDYSEPAENRDAAGQAALAFHATPAEIASWMWALGMGMGLCSVIPSLWLKKPVMVAWSTPGG